MRENFEKVGAWKMGAKKEAGKLHRIMAALVDMGISSVISLVIVQLLRLTGLNCSLIWFFLISIIVFELRDIIGRSVGKRIFGLYIVDSSDGAEKVSALRLLLRNSVDIVFPAALFQIYKHNSKSGDRLAKTKVCSAEGKNTAIKWISVIAAAVLLYVSYNCAGFSYMKNTDAYKNAVDHLCVSGYCESSNECELKAGNVFGRRAGFNIQTGKNRYDIILEYIDGEWKVTYCE
ncbi:MAG: RDD family protein [Ruminococcaceae bacterium]|nr:RDD family protein [Oscillospiraceae bacterium]